MFRAQRHLVQVGVEGVCLIPGDKITVKSPGNVAHAVVEEDVVGVVTQVNGDGTVMVDMGGVTWIPASNWVGYNGLVHRSAYVRSPLGRSRTTLCGITIVHVGVNAELEAVLFDPPATCVACLAE